MSDSERRRQDLLDQMKKSNYANVSVPAIHPRYGNIYQDLYQNKKETATSEYSLLFRLIISLLCFILYISFETSGAYNFETYNLKITSQIKKNVDYQEIQEVWKELWQKDLI